MSTKIRSGLRRKPDLNTLYSVNDDGSRNFLQPADVRGRWKRRKDILYAILLLIYLIVPWIKIGGQPALLIDLPRRHASILGMSFTRDDFYLVFFLLTGFGFTLFAVTALFGRVWCGFACPQTVFLEGVYRRIERWIEGNRNERLRRNMGVWGWDKVWRKVVKQIAFVFVTLLITHSALAYFIPTDELGRAMISSPREHWSAFLCMGFASALLYFDMAWFREQFCLILCPYGRLQSAMIDDDTVLVGYDKRRGEPRGPKGRVDGDCIDCGSCVNVCPTGIDIRNGLQMECIGCTNCIDACDHIMDQVDRPQGLIRNDSLKGFRGEQRRVLRPRLIGYAVLALIGLSIFLWTASGRTPFEASILRAQGMPYTLEEDRIQNLITVHLRNKSQEPQQFQIEPMREPDDPYVDFRWSMDSITLGPQDELKVPVFAFVSRDEYREPFEIKLRVMESTSGSEQIISLRFRGP